MEEKAVREQLEAARKDLRRVDEERDVLISMIRGCEGWLRLHGVKPMEPVAQPALPMKAPNGSDGATAISLRSALLQVLKDAHGEALHVREMVPRALRLGASTNAKSPVTVADFMLDLLKKNKGEPIEKIAPRTWRYVGNAVTTDAEQTIEELTE